MLSRLGSLAGLSQKVSPWQGNGNDSGPQGNSLSPSFETDDHLTNVVYNAGYRGLAFFGVNDQSLQILDPGDSPFDVDQVALSAWIMPTAHTIAPGARGYAAEAIIFNKESTYEIAISTESRGSPGQFIGAFSRCWRWWGGTGTAGLGVRAQHSHLCGCATCNSDGAFSTGLDPRYGLCGRHRRDPLRERRV